MKPKVNKHIIDRADLEALQLPPMSNLVIVHITHQNGDSTTDSGILVVGDQDYKPAEHAERWGYVYKVPSALMFEAGDPRSLEWKTEVECEVGDKVWFDFRSALYAYTLECDGEWYKLLSYSSLYVAKKDNGTVVPLNGYLLIREYYPPKESKFALDTKKDTRFGIVEYAGTPNKEYVLDFWNDDIDVNPGDHVLFEEGTSCFPLESNLHKEFSDKDYVLQQRKRVLAVVNESHTEILMLHEGVIVVQPREEKKEFGGIILNKGLMSHRYGDVIGGLNKSIPEGTKVVIPRKKATVFNDVEYYTEDRLLYYETT